MYPKLPDMDAVESVRFTDGVIQDSLSKNTFLYSEGLPEDVNPQTIKNVSLFEVKRQYLTQLPTFIKKFTNLEYLYLPAYTASSIKPDDLPDSVRTLVVYGGTIKLRSDLVLSSLEQLIVIEGECRFHHLTLPRLKMLSTDLDKGGSILTQILEMRRLKHLAIGPVRDNEMFLKLSTLSLASLNIRSGRDLHSLDGIENIHTLHQLQLVGFRELTNLERLNELIELTELVFLRCRIGDLSPLILHRGLTKLTLWACKPLPDLTPLNHIRTLQQLAVKECGPIDWDLIRAQIKINIDLIR